MPSFATKSSCETLQYEVELVLNGTETILSEGFSPGGLIKAVISVKVTPEKAASPLFAHQIMSLANDLLRESVRTKITPLSDQAAAAFKGTPSLDARVVFVKQMLFYSLLD